MEKRRKYSEEFKREAVGLTRQPGASVSEVGRDIGVGANLLFRWQREFDSGAVSAVASGRRTSATTSSGTSRPPSRTPSG